LSRNAGVRDRHGAGESYHAVQAPDVVVFPRSTEEVVAVVKICNERSIPIVPFGTGTSLEGHVACVRGGVSLDLSKHMVEIDEVNAEDMDCTVQAGCTRKALNTSLRHTGLEFTVDPGADASIGGMAACGASGTSAVRYGTMREAVLGLEAVMADGSVVRTGGRARKSSAGYDLTRLLVGSEGTLGVITKATLRLHPLPAFSVAATCAFPLGSASKSGLHSAASAVVQMLQAAIPLQKSEVLDVSTIRAFNAYNPGRAPLPELPHLFLEIGGASETIVADLAEMAREICDDFGALGFEWASGDEERRRLWEARHSTYYASLALRKDAKGFVTDACVPLSALADVLQATAKDVEEMGVVGPIFGHAGDGNCHCILPLRDDDPPEYLARVHAVNANLVRRALAAGGSCTGEHGVGLGKIGYLEEQYPPATLLMMRAIKTALDPKNILNPGKVLADRGAVA